MTGTPRTYESTDDPRYPCSLCAIFVCGYCGKSDCDDDCDGVIDQGAIVPIDLDGNVTRLYRDIHKGCQEAYEAYMEDVRRNPY